MALHYIVMQEEIDMAANALAQTRTDGAVKEEVATVLVRVGENSILFKCFAGCATM